MRIVGGKFRGKKLVLPEDKRVRPTSDRAREALFNILGHDSEMRGENGLLPNDAIVLDVFAGTGALGLEALSRGAVHVTFLDNHSESLKLVEQNVKNMSARNCTDILRRDAANPGKPGMPCDLILMDPPYGENLAAPTLVALKKNGWIKPDAIIVIEIAAKENVDIPPEFRLLKDRKYGAARLIFLRRDSDQYGDTSQTDPE
ncbi:16S rRNA (guanine(966)-N(2))-methyltransferase RsmD [Sneathiella sp. HT1-7]|jgi:16S rRNA (guanine966-N2)-methyltransferase|uniref:16S rRNA (guanine(966)-N(2))-methyltransferase RsmD n=1 Tax=Sneathiella sp. HT1-7 TaxID=2887192 RepID=UPI001D13A94E|nr:16S rRNA (guanine(966)-N(2))-methyltransferase RsmD [Sneathiella sp. HT1-7]MCC3303447.1 16S rRNA (guanine(966)-N(2))-methyltransferase RsmD [Sneathiella sp. HT1-7]